LAIHPRRSSTSSSEATGPRLRELLLAAAAGVALYLVTFGFCLDRPLTVDTVGDYLRYKTDYLVGIRDQRKIVIFAGSNGRYSHRCETIGNLTGLACANLSIAAGFGLGWQMSKYWPYLHKGDVLYLPLEYWPLFAPASQVDGEAPYLVRRVHSSLAGYRPQQLAAALFYFDVRYLFSAIGEMALARGGIQRRTSISSMTPQGDERDVTSAKAAAYAPFIASMPSPNVSLHAYDDARSIAALESLIDTATAKGIVVVGGLPTTFADAQIPADVIRRLRTLYEQRGACFLVLPNHSLYPRSAFFDTDYHLRESFQIAHSAALAPWLAQIARTGACPGAQ
jgi:hypothetical protein